MGSTTGAESSVTHHRLQFVVFVLGLFHLEMACADAIWRMYIEPKHLRTDPNGLYQHMCKIRPHDSSRIGSKPGFRLMHDLIHQCAAARMLDAWRVEVGRHNPSHSTLEAFATSQPSWEDVEALSLALVARYVDKPGSPDGEFRNASLILGRLLLYVELCHAMKHGDIGRVERTFLHWVFVFKKVGKHKYASELVRISNNLKHTYPPRLARAIRLNWLCNPTGKPDGFLLMVDWLVELMNLFTKVVYGSSGYTRTYQLVIKQSPLIELFRKVHTLFQDNFHLLHRSVRHAPPDLTNTIKILLEALQVHDVHVLKPGRAVDVQLEDHLRDGMHIMQTTSGMVDRDGEGDDDDDGEAEDTMDIGIDDLEAAE
ncbi:hypothetical protein L227DRAFT_515315 [Lentinus tigrinus ALCF2SS1-6]|uniref:DUF6589 domain-containing protein n=1 Tax=Lentinus tigrinus ALCF2SS1-6 TaxID=1328759 RepID=A0A5C2RLT0_9APHY|nr:hypothetical protein L227DRAFT_515315 [Lentinus tigrinus ALCF2SS1-6]